MRPSRLALCVRLAAILLPGPAGALPGPFVDVTGAAGVGGAHQDLPGPFDQARHVAGGVACGDVDGDGWLDLYVVRGSGGVNALLRNRGDGTFADVAAAAGVAIAGENGAGPTFADYDGDGDLDLLVLGVGATRPSLFRNGGTGTFLETTVSAGLLVQHDSYSAAFGDPDRDGDLDLAISHWATPLGSGPTELYWMNQGDGTFVEASAVSGVVPVPSPQVPTPFDFSFTPTFTDLDDDAWPDLLLASDFGTSRVFRNDQTGRFVDITTPVISDENGMGSAVGDVDGDGILDWFVSSVWDPAGTTIENWGTSGNRLYHGRGDGTFEDRTAAAGVRVGYWGWGATFADLDNDRDLDLLHTNGWFSSAAAAAFETDPTRLFVGAGDGTFTEAAATAGLDERGMGRGVVAFDYDRDGDLDLFLANNNGPPALYRNDLPREAHYLTLQLRGRAPNTQAVGGKVWITAGGVTQVRELRAGSNFESQDPAEVHVGLGNAALVERLRVRWPDGTEEVRGTLPPDRALRWIQGAPVCADSPTGRCLLGGRTAQTDCLLRTQVEARRTRVAGRTTVVSCRDGDPACDSDPTPAVCGLVVSLCVGGTTPVLSRCLAASQVAVDVRASDRGAEEALRAAAIGTALPEGGVFGRLDEERCSERIPLRVSLARRAGRIAAGTVEVRLRAQAGPRRDLDRLVLRCQPAAR